MLDAPQHGPRPLPLFLEMLRETTATSPERRAAALAGLKAYQEAPRRRNPSLPQARVEQGRAMLRSYGGSGRDVVFVPSLINPPFILDLAPQNSMLRWCSEQGLRPWLVDWGTPAPEDRDQDVTAHVERILIPLIEQFETPPLLVGYCLGGTMALAAAAATEVAGLAMIAAPWRFGGFGEARPAIADLWSEARPVCDSMGLVPMEVLQSGFWRLDPERTIGKYEAFGRLDPESDAAQDFIALEDWANAGAPLTYAVGRQLFEEFVGEDTPGSGDWIVRGGAVDPAALSCPAVEFVSLTDRIVPAASAANLPDHRDLGAGHVGMVVGSRARAQLWEPLAEWLRHA